MRGWIFDLDGTLVDSLPGIASSLNAALADFDLPQYEQAIVQTFIGDGAKMLVNRALGSGGLPMAEAVLDRFRIHYAEGWKGGTIPYPKVLETLRMLRQRGDKIAILSNKPHAFTKEIAEVLFDGLMDLALGESDSVPHKPDPRGIEIILEQWALSKAKVCMVGDSVMDLQAARAAGIKNIAVSWGYHTRNRLISESPDVIIDAMDELLTSLKI